MTWSVHEERFERFPFDDCPLHVLALPVKFAPEAGPGAVLFAGEFALHSPFVGDEESAPALDVKVNAAVPGFEVAARVEDGVTEEIERHGVRYGGSEGLDEIQRESWTTIFGLVKESDRRIEADAV